MLGPGAESDPGRPAEGPRRDAMLVVPLIGAACWLPPLAWAGAVRADILAVPAVVVFLFGSWAALIVAGALLSRRLGPGRGHAADPATRAVEAARPGRE